ncbi:hypothetical protein A1O3_01872 [Capronia epimyces CBS 606.96]|uniref:Fe2OG dioxygenase domain-containing protein n=1 Tax=Capronia epimyces CBS 606.96 TaxID=1182542 RepID=W9Y8E6_9EURO|nr:uncharacterized protein A1O3_01872 [Capronia epimyces CBS 606.96]EXJ88808.1 hypothetical protein A1O3_01872 [Capronia epimyces CBS 606.96]
MLFPAGSLPTGPPIETKKALLLLDFQNDFVSPEGKVHVANVLSFLPNLLALVAEFRAKGEVIWVGTEYKQPQSTISTTTGSYSILLKQNLGDKDTDGETREYIDNPRCTSLSSQGPFSPSTVTHDREAFLAAGTAAKDRCCIPGTPGADFPGLIKDAIDSQRDLVMLKSHYSAFPESPLLMHLRTRLITELYICGSLSNVAVYATVLDAVCHGLQVTIVEDCLGFKDEKCHVEAMRQMADHMGASGVDCQELRDDLAGLLGDVVREEDYTTRFQVTIAPPARRIKSHTSRKHIHDWIARLEGQENKDICAEDAAKPSNMSAEGSTDGRDSSCTKSELSRRLVRSVSPDHGPPRKRSTSDVDSPEEAHIPKLSHSPSIRRASNPGDSAEQLKRKQTNSSTRKKRPSNKPKESPSPTYDTVMVHTQFANNAGAGRDDSSDNDPAQREEVVSETARCGRVLMSKKKERMTPRFLEPDDIIGQGDCQLYLDLLGPEEAERAFHSCKKGIRWQKMFHRSGEVPRLVAVQGRIAEDGSCIPVYRHPADESPELLAFDPTVDTLRKAAEKVVGHHLNHVLIQWYRNGEDNISEHTDKTLDIVRGSSIVNLSLGAQRTMSLRKKRSSVASDVENLDSDATRPCQRIRLPHKSLFVLGEETNRHWLHAIRADKRPPSQKDPAELAYGGERISLTFRHIGTFINPIKDTIWGQGATRKHREGAQHLLAGTEAEKQGEIMIRAFGQENHRSTDWDWDTWYGKGFDVVNFETKKA